jgi:hypothetical protein
MELFLRSGTITDAAMGVSMAVDTFRPSACSWHHYEQI